MTAFPRSARWRPTRVVPTQPSPCPGSALVMRISFVTTVTRSYLPLARVLMDSVARHHPDSSRYVLVLDDGTGITADAEILRPSDVIEDELELTIRQTIYHPIEYATSLKPLLLAHLLRESGQVFFVDPDMRLFQPI